MTRLVVIAVALAGAVALGIVYGFGRLAIALLLSATIVAWSYRKLRKVLSVPPEPEVADVSGYGLKYVCSVCGLSLKVEIAARDKAPTHCGEKMELVREGGRAPLRPV